MSTLTLQMVVSLIDKATAPLRRAAEAASAASETAQVATTSTAGLQAAQEAAAKVSSTMAEAVREATDATEKQGDAADRVARKQAKNTAEAEKAVGPLGRLKNALDRLREAGEQDFRFAADLRQAAEPIEQMGASIRGAARAAIDAAAPFDALIGQAGAAARATDDELADLRQAAYDIGGTTTLGAHGAAKALASLGAAGMSAREQIEALDESLAIAEVTGLDAGDAAAALSRAASGFSVPADQVGRLKDIVASASNASGALEAMGRASAAANLAGFSADDTAALYEALQQAGMGEQAVEGVGQTFEALSRKATQDLLKGAGIRITDTTGQMRPLVDVLGDLQAKLDGLPVDRVASALDQAFGGGAKAVSAALGQIDVMRRRTTEIADGDALRRVADRNKGILMGWADLGRGVEAAVDSLRAAVGDQLLPVANELAVAFISTANAVRAWIQEHPTATRVVVALTAGVGGLLTGLSAVIKVVSVASSAKGVLAMVPALGGVAKAVLVALAPIALLLTALGGLAYAVAVVARNWEHFGKVWAGYWDGFVGLAQTNIAKFLEVVAPVLDFIGLDISGAAQQVRSNALGNLASGIRAAERDSRDGGAQLWAPERVLGGLIPGLFGRQESVPAKPPEQRVKISVDVSGDKPKVHVASDSPGIEVPASAGMMGVI